MQDPMARGTVTTTEVVQDLADAPRLAPAAAAGEDPGAGFVRLPFGPSHFFRLEIDAEGRHRCAVVPRTASIAPPDDVEFFPVPAAWLPS
jgi:hypothetical protein